MSRHTNGPIVWRIRTLGRLDRAGRGKTQKAAEHVSPAAQSVALVETGESRTPRPEEPINRISYKLVRRFVLGLFRYRRRNLERPSRLIFGRHYRRQAGRIPDLWRLASPLPGIAGSRRSRFRRLERIHVRQLFLRHRINEVDGFLGLQSVTEHPCRTRASPFCIVVATRMGFEPTIFGVTGQYVNRYTTGPRRAGLKTRQFKCMATQIRCQATDSHPRRLPYGWVGLPFDRINPLGVYG